MIKVKNDRAVILFNKSISLIDYFYYDNHKIKILKTNKKKALITFQNVDLKTDNIYTGSY